MCAFVNKYDGSLRGTYFFAPKWRKINGDLKSETWCGFGDTLKAICAVFLVTSIDFFATDY